MKSIGSLYQSGDWKGEKHVPVIHAPENVKAGEDIEIKVLVGEEIPHPNTLEHYIAWIKVYFLQDGNKFPVEIGSYTFQAHGESEIYTQPFVSAKFKASKSGTIIATSYCNIHGLWENSVELKVE
ncbi:class II SORL domain-containing protein [Paratissierella segnis]|jgi:superoxide reductase|uniref:Class II SORL domain-containing protein n=1 Tax=Paratissierella segnis TaxID=2763679 RepID=A0A926EUJ9_9FIRM|nr:class II SORL domain-containing protein [Paratissierella segnis]MBC8587916.1 class II SORL domain-containing protein [Paratissierella segnis]